MSGLDKMCKFLNDLYINIVAPMTYAIKILMYEFYITTEAEIFSSDMRVRMTS